MAPSAIIPGMQLVHVDDYLLTTLQYAAIYWMSCRFTYIERVTVLVYVVCIFTCV